VKGWYLAKGMGLEWNARNKLSGESAWITKCSKGPLFNVVVILGDLRRATGGSDLFVLKAIE